MPNTTLLFCYNDDMRKAPAMAFEPEAQAALDAGFKYLTLGFEDFIAGRDNRAFEFLPHASQPTTLFYRGFIFKEHEYRRLQQALSARGYSLFTPPDAYTQAVYLTHHHQKLAPLTPPAVWTTTKNLDTAWQTANLLGPGPWLVKDHIKSAKHRWEDACFIPANSTRENFDRICTNLLAYQGDWFERGFVFKKFIPLREIGDNRYGYPAVDEYRLIYLNQKLFSATPYNRTGGTESDFSQFQPYAQKFTSQFLCLDVALTAAGQWLIIEAGDASVCALPPKVDKPTFYKNLHTALP
jgi:hypothetical protein